MKPCRTTVRSEVDFVLTFEEVMGMFEAKGINFNEITQTAPLREGTAAGRGFAVSGGVAEAVREAISHIDPDREVKTACAQGLKDCRKMLTLAKAGKYNGYLLEGMACPGGCVAGARYAPADREGGGHRCAITPRRRRKRAPPKPSMKPRSRSCLMTRRTRSDTGEAPLKVSAKVRGV